MQCLRWVLNLFFILALFAQFSQPLASPKSNAITQTTSPTCYPADKAALLTFKSKITQDTTTILSSWVGSNCCGGDWEGVECSSSIGRVTSLILQNPSQELYMKGTISSSLGNLSFLEVLIISGMKHIKGAIPNSLSNLKRLSQLVLEDNSLSGIIPDDLSQIHSLKTLSLGGNLLQGAIPPNLGSLRGLAQLNLARNQIVGPIPKSINLLQNLQFLDLSHNLLSGTIPDSVGQFHNLTYLDLSYNNLSGSIPISLCNLPTLSDLFLNNNNLNGNIPNEISRLKKLSSLSLGNNQLDGTIPESLANLENLWYLNLSRNALTNPFPNALAKGIPSLSTLDLSYNSLDLGTFPSWIMNRELSAVHLAGCKLVGKLPQFTKPNSLISLDLSHNHFTGEGMQDFLTQMPSLQMINLSNNDLKYDISNITLPQGVSFIDISSNQLFGSISSILGNSTSSFLETIDVSSNLISGTFPEFRSGLNLKVLIIHGNKIEGHISSSISNLAELQHMDISKNQISGTIPTSLGLFSELQWLDVSINRLIGDIPSSLLGIKTLKHANFRANKLCGQIPQGRPFDIFPVAAYAHNNCLCGKPLPPCEGKRPGKIGKL